MQALLLKKKLDTAHHYQFHFLSVFCYLLDLNLYLMMILFHKLRRTPCEFRLISFIGLRCEILLVRYLENAPSLPILLNHVNKAILLRIGWLHARLQDLKVDLYCIWFSGLAEIKVRRKHRCLQERLKVVKLVLFRCPRLSIFARIVYWCIYGVSKLVSNALLILSLLFPELIEDAFHFLIDLEYFKVFLLYLQWNFRILIHFW